MNHPANIAIIGAGIAGLTSAWHLEQLGHRVTIFEASDRTGGLIRSERTDDGFLLDLGPNTVPDRRGTLRTMIQALDLERRLVKPNNSANKRYIVRDGEMVSLPSSPTDLFNSAFLSNGAKLRILKEVITPKQDDDSLDESLANFVKRHFGQEVLDYALNPFIAGTYGGQPEHLSARYTFGRLLELEAATGSIILGGILKALGAAQGESSARANPGSGELINFDEGEQVLTDAITQDLDASIHLHAHVQSVERQGMQWHITWQSRRNKNAPKKKPSKKNTSKKSTSKHTTHKDAFDAVLCATPAYVVPTIDWREGEYALDMQIFDEIVYPPIANIAMTFRREDVIHPLDGFGVLVPEVEEMNILGAIFNSTIFKGRAPEDHVLLLTFLGGARQPEMVAKSQEEREALALADLQDLLSINGEPLMVRHQQWSRAIPQYEVGYERILKGIDRIETHAPGLFFAGNYREGISVSDTAHHAAQMAGRIGDYWQGRLSIRRLP